MVYGIKQLSVESMPVGPAVALVAGAAIGSLFVRRQLRLETPLLDLRLLHSRRFTAVIAGGLVGSALGSLRAAREAFTASLHVTGVVAAVIFAGLAVLILTMRPATRARRAALPGYEAARS